MRLLIEQYRRNYVEYFVIKIGLKAAEDEDI